MEWAGFFKESLAQAASVREGCPMVAGDGTPLLANHSALR
jgi:hypothetical protein